MILKIDLSSGNLGWSRLAFHNVEIGHRPLVSAARKNNSTRHQLPSRSMEFSGMEMKMRAHAQLGSNLPHRVPVATRLGGSS